MKTAFTTLSRWLTRSAVTAIVTVALLLASDLIAPQSAAAYPFWAQAAYESPREATGRIVCANCHLASKTTQVELPQAVLPNTVFEAVVKVPYDKSIQQVTGTGERGPLNVGAVIMLPKGFKIAPEDRLTDELKEKTEGLFYQQYAEDKENIVIIGPLPGDEYQEIVFPVLSPDPTQDKTLNFGKYPVFVGGNRGRGQVYPTGEKTNNTVYTTTVAGTVGSIAKTDDGGYQIAILKEDGTAAEIAIPVGPEPIVKEGETVAAGQALTNDPNVGGFGQADGEIVLQNPDRIKWLLVFFAAIMLGQTLLVLKKKQVEKVQAAELNF